MILGYCRVSTEGQKENTSPEEQERVLRGFAQMKGVRAYDIQIFHDCISGSTPLMERPGGRDLLAAVKPGDTVVAVKLDRLFRSACDALAMAQKFKTQGVDLVLTDMGNDPVTQNGPAKLFFIILAGVAEFERDRIAERVGAGKAIKKARGGNPGGSAPFGYRIKGHGKEAMIEPCEEEQRVVQVVRALSASLPPQKICHELEARGLRNRAGNAFQCTQVMRMMARG